MAGKYINILLAGLLTILLLACSDDRDSLSEQASGDPLLTFNMTRAGGDIVGNTLVYLFDVSLDNKDKEAKTDKIQLEKQNWKLSAKKAKLTKDQMLYLEGGVVAESLDPLSRLQRVETEAAVINLKTQDITSDTQVKINGLNFNSSGLKLVGNLRQQVATLKEQVKTYYEINKQ